MNLVDKNIDGSAQFFCGFKRHNGCVFEDVAVTEAKKIRSATINFAADWKSWQKCDFFRNEETFNMMLDFIERDCFVNIMIAGKLPSDIMEYLESNDNFNYMAYRANKDFSAIFSRENPYTILYYYTNINSKSNIVTGVLLILIKLRLYRLLWRIYAENHTIVLKRVK